MAPLGAREAVFRLAAGLDAADGVFVVLVSLAPSAWALTGRANKVNVRRREDRGRIVASQEMIPTPGDSTGAEREIPFERISTCKKVSSFVAHVAP
jgi:hypothetical protein